jgi:thiamine-monophosphate kinase
MSSSEFDIIRRFFTRPAPQRDDVPLGIGDDAALLVPPPGMSLAVSVDTLVAGVHFPLDTSAEAIGYKALAVNLSDLAAMGAEPAWATLAITLPSADDAWLSDFAVGFFALAEAHQVQLVGGDTTRGPLSITVQVMGFVPAGEALTRGGARAGEGIYVTGSLGDAAAGLRLKQGMVSDQGLAPDLVEALIARLERPTPRVAAGRALRGLASSAIDISDGLAADLGHVLAASGVGAVVDCARLPLSAAYQALAAMPAAQLDWRTAVSQGDDYELCFTVPADREAELQLRLAAVGCGYIRIGETMAEAGLHWRDAAGHELPLPVSGFDHFAAAQNDKE